MKKKLKGDRNKIRSVNRTDLQGPALLIKNIFSPNKTISVGGGRGGPKRG